jgi:threonine aldolase
MENAHNYAGGTVLPIEHVEAMSALARERGLAVHMDGARLFNAQAATGVPVARWVKGVDLTSVCLSKGLGAPVGSLVVGSTMHIEAARRLRKLLGGGMRQAGVLAAPALIALTEGPAALVEDHRRARALAAELAGLPGLEIDLDSVQTNIVVGRVAGAGSSNAWDLEARFKQQGVLIFALDTERIRFVFHRDVGDDALDAAVSAARRILD